MNNIKSFFTIRDLENISGVKAHTIRIWEKRYTLFQPERTSTNIRYYSPQNLQKLLNISLLNNNGFKISKIALMSYEEICHNSREVGLKSARNDEAINSLKLSMFQFDKVLFNKTYNELLLKNNFKKIFKEVFIPLLEQIGLLWQTDTLLPAHEHFISNLITQKVQINIEKLQYNIAENSKTYVLFLPENEIHELGLLYLNYELASRGEHTIYLGQSLPLDNLNLFFKSSQEITFVTSMTVQPYDEKLKTYFDTIDAILEGTNHKLIAIGKKAIMASSFKFISNIKLYDSVYNLLNVL